MSFTPAFNRNEEAAQIEGPIASRLRSRFKIGDVKTSQTECTPGIGVNNQTDKPSQQSRHQKDRSNTSVAKKSEVHTASTRTSTIGQPSTDKHTNKSNDSKAKSNDSFIKFLSAKNREDSSETLRKQDVKNQHPKMKASQPPLRKTESSSNCRTEQSSKNQDEFTKIESPVTNISNSCKPSSSGAGKEKGKEKPSQRQAKESIREHPIHYIRWKGSQKTTTCWSCALCEKNMAYFPNREELKHPSHEENELRFSFLWREGEELTSVLPEASVLPCSHVFHSICLSTAMQITELIDPRCPICLSMS